MRDDLVILQALISFERAMDNVSQAMMDAEGDYPEERRELDDRWERRIRNISNKVYTTVPSKYPSEAQLQKRRQSFDADPSLLPSNVDSSFPDTFHCAACEVYRRDGYQLYRHHVQPLNHWGLNTPENLLFLCLSCHRILTDYQYDLLTNRRIY
jgi:hypothetical protein